MKINDIRCTVMKGMGTERLANNQARKAGSRAGKFVPLLKCAIVTLHVGPRYTFPP